MREQVTVEVTTTERAEPANGLPYKIAFGALLALLAAYCGIASLGATGSWSHGFNAALAIVVGAWIGWLIRDCDEA